MCNICTAGQRPRLVTWICTPQRRNVVLHKAALPDARQTSTTSTSIGSLPRDDALLNALEETLLTHRRPTGIFAAARSERCWQSIGLYPPRSQQSEGRAPSAASGGLGLGVDSVACGLFLPGKPPNVRGPKLSSLCVIMYSRSLVNNLVHNQAMSLAGRSVSGGTTTHQPVCMTEEQVKRERQPICHLLGSLSHPSKTEPFWFLKSAVSLAPASR